ncbi:hypothetical protein HDV02_001012 [Globomyces sp. JEL0801]|nr:hypothetical protein HDV02_001012 [Globomyces sp. JEL0801]
MKIVDAIALNEEQLKTELSARSLDATGTKEEMLKRLVAYLEETITTPTSATIISDDPEAKRRARAARFGVEIKSPTTTNLAIPKKTAGTSTIAKSAVSKPKSIKVELDADLVAKRKAKFGNVTSKVDENPTKLVKTGIVDKATAKKVHSDVKPGIT